MRKPASKRRHITAEYFDYVKSELFRVRGKKVYRDLADRFICSIPTVKRIDVAKDFTDFEHERKDRSAKTTAARMSKETPNQHEFYHTEPENLLGLQPKSDSDVLLNAINSLTEAILRQTKAIEANTKSCRGLRDRMAVANQIKSREIHMLSGQERENIEEVENSL